MKGRPCENQQLDPDIEVQLTPADQLSGHDTQLQRAVELMMGKE
jgi:C-terminal processing protease CtpA/Prc